ncbi:AbiU2 domain-containing protein [Paludisphaera soli]|uniref:AbiU2 domain-containing protein n=1 Tax=Paludisphaera soli TaxID=2712865 RepID=UPI0013EB836D|nr:hypothetical protein [Paludisphaera soli]
MDQHDKIDGHGEPWPHLSGEETIATCLVIHDQVMYASRLYAVSIQLFHGRKPSELWNELVPYGMGLVQRTPSHAMVMTICRIIDPAETGKGKGARENCTFERLADLVNEDWRLGLARSIRNAIGACKFDLEAIRPLRNKYLAHLDHGVSVREPTVNEVEGYRAHRVIRLLSLTIEEVRVAYGLAPIVPPSRGRDGMGFAGLDEMPDGGFDRLVSLLEDVREGRPVSWPEPFRPGT